MYTSHIYIYDLIYIDHIYIYIYIICALLHSREHHGAPGCIQGKVGTVNLKVGLFNAVDVGVCEASHF